VLEQKNELRGFEMLDQYLQDASRKEDLEDADYDFYYSPPEPTNAAVFVKQGLQYGASEASRISSGPVETGSARDMLNR
jgi:hypothetical protein